MTVLDRVVPEDWQHYLSHSMQGAKPNVGGIERIVSTLAGGSLMAIGIGKRSLGGLAISAIGGALLYRGMRGTCPAYHALGISTTATTTEYAGVLAQHGRKVERSIEINAPAAELYRQWRQLEQLPEMFSHLVAVEEYGQGRSHWVARGPLGTTVHWDAEIINEKPGRLIAWQSLAGGEVATAGSVHFEEKYGTTTITVSLKFDPPGGEAGLAAASFLGSGLEESLEEDLTRFKERIETSQRAAAHVPEGTRG